MAKLITKDETKITSEHGISEFTDYPFSSQNLSLGISKVHGRYPATGFDLDSSLEQIWYVIEGTCVVKIKDGSSFKLQKDDMLYLDAGEAFVIDGDVTLVVASAPAWTEHQHQHIE